ncbi:hypothetical protein NIES39_D06950 [Arthrospira platensis NIES-39]|nr:hypothetical protein NIES39_D06950 [Arthrospira platensis NIES-39]
MGWGDFLTPPTHHHPFPETGVVAQTPYIYVGTVSHYLMVSQFRVFVKRKTPDFYSFFRIA